MLNVNTDAAQKRANDLLAGEINGRLSRELDNFLSSVKIQIQRAIEEAISGQLVPQIRSSLRNIKESVGINSHFREEPEPRSEDNQPRDRNTQHNNFNAGSTRTLGNSNHRTSHYNATFPEKENTKSFSIFFVPSWRKVTFQSYRALKAPFGYHETVFKAHHKNVLRIFKKFSES